MNVCFLENPLIIREPFNYKEIIEGTKVVFNRISSVENERLDKLIEVRSKEVRISIT